MKVMVASKEHMEAHYADLAGLKFFNGLVSFMVRTPAVALCVCYRATVPTG